MLAGMLRVAAQEAAELNWAHSSSSALQATGWAPNATSAADAFGVVLAAGMQLRPQLQHVTPLQAWGMPQAAPRATLITGGLGALGTLLATHLLATGERAPHAAAHLVLLGRSVAGLPAAASTLVRTPSPIAITLVNCDSARAGDVAALAASLRAAGIQPARLVHAAGVLRDGMREVLAPKAAASRNQLLDLAGSAAPLPQLLLFSSIAGLLGSSGQANYSAANGLLDALAGTLRDQVRACTTDVCASSLVTQRWVP